MEISLLELAPPTWTRTTLGEIVAGGGGSIQTGPFGSQLHASDYVPEGVPSIMPVNIGKNRLIRDGIACIRESDAQRLSKHIVRKGDIIYSRRGDVERRAIVRESEDGWFCGTGCLKVRLGQGVIVPEFAAFYLGHPEVRSWIVRHAVGITMPNLNTSIMKAVPFLLPPLDEQQAISETLQSLDDKIEQNRRTGAKLEALARAVFKAWFVDFEPVKAKAAGATAFPGMPPETFAALPTRLTDSELGPVPDGWTHLPLGDLVTLQRGKTYKSALKGMPGPYLLGLGAIKRNGGFKGDSLTTYGGDSPDNLLVRPGDLYASLKDVTQSADLLGAVARVPPDFGIGRLTQDTVRLVPKTPFPENLTYQQLQTPAYREYCRGCATGTTNLGLSRDDFLAYPIIMPASPIASAYEHFAEAIMHSQAHQRTESAKLAALRDYLLPRLLSGRVRVREAGETSRRGE